MTLPLRLRVHPREKPSVEAVAPVREQGAQRDAGRAGMRWDGRPWARGPSSKGGGQRDEEQRGRWTLGGT